MKNKLIKILPSKLLNFISIRPLRLFIDLYNGNYVKICYSQQGEDLFILEYFNKKWGGFFVDIGAFHPKQYSNTFQLTRYGWKGINIEPNHENFKLFLKHRKKDINLNCGIDENQKIIEYYAFNNAAVNTFDKSHKELWEKVNGFELKYTKLIEVVPLSFVLESYAKNRTIDFLNIDVEGLDLNILKSNDWVKFRPKLIAIEENILNYNSLNESNIYNFLIDKNYKLIRIQGITLFFESN